MAIQVLISKSLESKEGKNLFRQTNAFAFLCSSLPTAASFPIKMNSNQVQKRKKRGSAKLSRWANGKKNKRCAGVPVQDVADVADVAMAEQAHMDAADPISIDLKQATKNKQLYDRKRYLTSKLETMDDVVSDLQDKVKDFKKSVGVHALLEAAAQAKAADLKATAEKAAKLLDDRTTRFNEYRKKRKYEIKETKAKAREKLEQLADKKEAALGMTMMAAERKVSDLQVCSFLLRPVYKVHYFTQSSFIIVVK